MVLRIGAGMLFYDNGYIYDTDKGNKFPATQSVIEELESNGVSIAGLHGEDWKSANMLKIQALTGLRMYHVGGNIQEGTIHDVFIIDGRARDAESVDIILSHYIHTVCSLHVDTPCNIILDNTLIFPDKFSIESYYGVPPCTFDIGRLSDLKAYKFLWGLLGSVLSLHSFDISSIKLDDSRLKSLAFIILMHNNSLRSASDFTKLSDIRSVFEPYYSSIASVFLNLNRGRGDIRVHSGSYDMLTDLDFATEAYFSALLSELYYGSDREAKRIITDCLIMLKLFGYLPDGIKCFLTKEVIKY